MNVFLVFYVFFLINKLLNTSLDSAIKSRPLVAFSSPSHPVCPNFDQKHHHYCPYPISPDLLQTAPLFLFMFHFAVKHCFQNDF